jgi:hypothetical protein
MTLRSSAQAISVIVPANPFIHSASGDVTHCLAALNVQKLMQWWPGQPHEPHRNPTKVRAIQRSLDWKRVAQIAAYLLQEEIIDAPERLDTCFADIYEPTKLEPGRGWPPKVPRVVGYQRSEYPTFSNVLLHVNVAKVEPMKNGEVGAAKSGSSVVRCTTRRKRGERRIPRHATFRSSGPQLRWPSSGPAPDASIGSVPISVRTRVS